MTTYKMKKDISLHEYLRDLWLSDKYAVIYLCLLEIGQAPVSVIARRAKINRSSVYVHLQEMLQKWYVYSFSKKDIAYFSCVDVELIVQMHEHKIHRVKESIPLFSQLSQTFDNKPKMHYYEGFDWLKNLYQRILDESTTKEIVWFLSQDGMDEKLKDYLYTRFVPERVRRKISVRILLPETLANTHYVTDAVWLKKIKYMKHNLLEHTPCEINLFGEDKIAIVLYQENSLCAIYLSSSYLYNVLYSFFTVLRDTSNGD